MLRASLLLLLVLPCIFAVLFEEEEKQFLLERHNYYRRERVRIDQASNMRLMRWHEGLAKTASDWAETCIWDHGFIKPFPESVTYPNLGQNLWYGTKFNLNGTMRAFYKEINYYTYETRACEAGKKCGHYTQLVWADTYEVGCGYQHCGNRYIVACNYGPPGNYKRQYPYKKGAPCSSCESGTGWCDTDGEDGMCVDYKCTEPGEACNCPLKCENGGTMHPPSCTCYCAKGWMGTTCTEECADTHPYCGGNYGPWICTYNDESYDFYRNQCKKMCCLCEPAGETKCAPITAPPYNYTTIPNKKKHDSGTSAPTSAITLFLPLVIVSIILI